MEEADLVAAQGATQALEFNLGGVLLVAEPLGEEGGEVVEGVRKGVAEVNDVPFVNEPILKGKTVVGLIA